MPSLGARERCDDALPEVERGLAWRPMDRIRQFAAVGAFFGAGLVFSSACWVLWKATGGAMSHARGQLLLSRVFRGFVEILRVTGCLELRVEGSELLQRMEGTIIAANHPGLLDAIFIVAHQQRTACVMRANLLQSPVLCGSALLAGYVTNDSGSDFVRQAVEKIRSGGNLLIFPEGTRTRTQAVNGFKPGFAAVAVRSGAPVQTILIGREGAYLSKGTSIFSPLELPFRVTIRVGERFVPSPGETARELTTRIEDWFRSQLRNTGGSITLPSPEIH